MKVFRTGLYLHLQHRHLPVSAMVVDRLRSFRTRVQPRHRNKTGTPVNHLQARRCLLPPQYRLDRMSGLRLKPRQLADLRTICPPGPTPNLHEHGNLSDLMFHVQPIMVPTVVTKAGVRQMTTIDQSAPVILCASAKLRQDAADVNYLVAELPSACLRQRILENGLGETLENMMIATCALLHAMHERHPCDLQHGIRTLGIPETSEINVIDRIREVMLDHLRWSLDGCLLAPPSLMNIPLIDVTFLNNITHVTTQSVEIMCHHEVRKPDLPQQRRDLL